MTAPAIYPSLSNKTVLVTGGAEGIGAATVERFAYQGCQVLILDINKEAAQRTITHISHLQSQTKESPSTKTPIFYPCDLSSLEETKAIIAKILAEWTTIDVLINNAAATGKGARLRTEDVTSDSWDFLTRFLPHSGSPSSDESRRAGSIVNIGSITWRIPAPDSPVYAACKAAVMGLTRVQSKEVGAANIRINSVMPGAIVTQRQREDVLTPESRAEVMRGQSLQRDLLPEEVAKVIVFLASDKASGVTGSIYTVDGGWCSDP
ncbi:short chain dehydrogenase [Penicillium malachiteum]|uniref:short chain dehydrogenase n=1 Tax=Penicillium malachiteum TaxID=1324776 RepID=UPI0025484548|nr:short chain dehydrogenase [Penicillium malachiteum]KAJ5721723.1 short chain dehydrogenase [Penicillium malachiteum]